ncbi:MFS general substrate transporter [Ramicandelaber brevisporus]|nr:MFS general substrate transporter [Ramicandelaber brevisporus]
MSSLTKSESVHDGATTIIRSGGGTEFASVPLHDEKFDKEQDEAAIGSDTENDQTACPSEQGSPPLREPPDGGYGFVVLISTFICMGLSFGMINAYGAFNRYYTEVLFKGRESPSTISFVGTLTVCMMNLLGPFSGYVNDLVGVRMTVVSGSIIMCLGMILASFAHELWQLFLTQGILVGIGSSMIYLPCTSLPAQWFQKYRGLATGFAIAGSGVGGLALAPITTSLISSMGIHWALRVMGFIVLGGTFTAGLLLKPLNPPPKDRPRPSVKDMYKWVMFKDIKFVFLLLSGVCSNVAYFVPLYYLPVQASRLGYTASQASSLLSVLNGGSVAGRVLGGYAADLVGPVNNVAVSVLIAAGSVFILWLPFTTIGPFYAFAVIYGAFCGAYISNIPLIVIDTWGAAGFASTLGLTMMGNAIGSVSGSPIAGAILGSDPTTTNFTPVILFGGCILAGCDLFLCLFRVSRTRKLLVKI